jgi:glycosyltransferase involved in cell wall biosynthesis
MDRIMPPSTLPKSEAVDIMLISEGTYPYVRGGVSSWIHQLMIGLPEFNFGIIFIGSQAKDYEETKYKFPKNLTHLEVHYLFDEKKHHPKKRRGDQKSFKILDTFHKQIQKKDPDIPSELQNIDFFIDNITNEDFLYSKESWLFMKKLYEQNSPNIPFIDYFWTVRNIHAPIWKLATIVKNMPKTKLIHAPSTGYAGFLSFLASNDKKIPFLLTEHGIYTRERKIDVLSANWVSYQSPALLKEEPEEMNYIKEMWVRFFEKIGYLSYQKASKIISLYPGAKEIQEAYGADSSKTVVIPNGINLKHLKSIYQKRDDTTIPKVVTLIGRVVPIKDIKTFIRAISIAKQSMPEIEGWIVGGMDEEPNYANECKDMVSSFDLKDSISFLGFQNIDDILPKSGLLTLTSISEGMPLVILEGFAAGLPCISTDVGSCKELIYGALDEEDIAIGKAGEVTTIADPASLAKYYLLYLNDKDLWEKAQISALKRVERYYQEDLFLKQYRKLYKEMINWQE